MRRQLDIVEVRRVMQKARTTVVSIINVVVTTLPTAGISISVTALSGFVSVIIAMEEVEACQMGEGVGIGTSQQKKGNAGRQG